jgi:hypothetical protein
MDPGRFFILVAFAATLFAASSPADAGWGFGGGNRGHGSGLDLEHGYDRNTVATQQGTIVSIDREEETGPVLAIMRVKNGTTTLVLGPKKYWRDNVLPLLVGDTVTATGSRAMGSDGASYLIVQRIVIPARREEITLRDETGRPAWSGKNRIQRQHRHRGGRQN